MVAKVNDPKRDAFIIRGETLAFTDDPFIVPPEEAVVSDSDGAVVVEGGVIAKCGPAAEILAANPALVVHHYPGHLIMAGFVDSHAHYPQYEIIASYGEQLLEWLNRYTFPAELRFSDPAYAQSTAEIYLDACLRNGTTSASIFATVHPQSVDAIFSAAQARGMCIAAGKVMMDREAPDGLRDTAETGYEQSKTLIDKWHGKDRLVYAVTPRFAVTSTAAQLEAAGALWKEHSDTLMQTHIDESHAEIDLVAKLFPECADYFAVYETFGLVGPRANFGHAIHLKERELAAFKDSGSAISHCPTSNMFLGSGLMNLARLKGGEKPIDVGLATDIGGGSSMSMFQTMRAAYEVQRLQGNNLNPIQAFYLASAGSARALRLDHRIGNLAKGMDADIIVIDKASTPLIANRIREVSALSEALFVQMILADDRAIRATYIDGRLLHQRKPSRN